MVSRVNRNTVVLFVPIIRSDSIIDFMELKIFVTDLEHKHQGQITTLYMALKIYRETCLTRTHLVPTFVFVIDRCLVYTD